MKRTKLTFVDFERLIMHAIGFHLYVDVPAGKVFTELAELVRGAWLSPSRRWPTYLRLGRRGSHQLRSSCCVVWCAAFAPQEPGITFFSNASNFLNDWCGWMTRITG